MLGLAYFGGPYGLYDQPRAVQLELLGMRRAEVSATDSGRMQSAGSTDDPMERLRRFRSS